MIGIDGLAIGVAKSLITSAIQKGLKTSDEVKYQNKLREIIYNTVNDYVKENPIPEKDGKYPFYQSQIIVNAILSNQLFSDFNTKKVLEEFQKDKRVIEPQEGDINQFIEIFQHYFKKDKTAIKLGIEAQYKGEIFNISQIVTDTNERTKRIENKIDKLSLSPKEKKYLSQVPPIDPSEVIGREKELQEISELLEKENKVVLVNGIGGIGKTTVAKLYTELNKDKFDHLVLCLPINSSPPKLRRGSAR